MNNKYKILIVEDEENIRKFITALFEANGYQVLTASNASDGFLMHGSHMPDLILLDLGLPDKDGIEFIKEIRQNSLTPIIVLSARSSERDKVTALDSGANDYVTKPFGSAELAARVRSILRVSRHSADEGKFPGGKFESGVMTIDYDTRKFYFDGREIKLTQTEFNIIALLSEHFGKVMTYSAIIKEIWGFSDTGSIKKLQVNMANIRKKLSLKPGENQYISNELGVGYRLHNDNE
ncbi:MAG: response regulator transcription factor [Clostridia bacterium]|nr:response regulator transcription factor [Clostridia bacterium]